MEYTITRMKCVTTKYGNKVVITIDFKGEMVNLLAPRHFDSKAADLEIFFIKVDKNMILKVIERKNKF